MKGCGSEKNKGRWGGEAEGGEWRHEGGEERQITQ